MTKSNNEWVPEIDSQCEFIDNFGEWHKVTITGRGRNLTLFIEEGTTNEQCTLTHQYKFRPIKTEAEKRRDLAVAEMKADYRDTQIVKTAFDDAFCEKLIDAGWIKPRELTLEVYEIIYQRADNSAGVMVLANQFVRGELEL